LVDQRLQLVERLRGDRLLLARELALVGDDAELDEDPGELAQHDDRDGDPDASREADPRGGTLIHRGARYPLRRAAIAFAQPMRRLLPVALFLALAPAAHAAPALPLDHAGR